MASKSERTIGGLLLDFGGVLTTNFFEPFERFCTRHGLAPNTIHHLMSADPAGRALWRDVERGAISQQEFETKLASMLGLSPDGLIEQLLADLQPEPRMLAAVAAARGAGVRVAITSNSWGTKPYDPYEGWELPKLADVVLISHELGMRKPDPRIYQLAAERLGLAPTECVLIDDIAANLPAARELGMRTIHHVDAEATIGALERLLALPLRADRGDDQR